MTQPISFKRRAVAAALLLAACGAPALAQTYPTKPITLVVGFPAGGAFDATMRALADEMSKTLGQQVNVDNRPGAGGSIGTQAVVAAPADGYTLLAAGLQLATGPHLNKISYNPQKDLIMVRQVTAVPVLLLVPGTSTVKSSADLVALAKGKNGITVGTGGVGTTGHFGTFMLNSSLKVPVVHVPFRGGGPGLQALAGGEIDAMFDQSSTTMASLISAGKVKVVSVMQDAPVPSLKDVKPAPAFGVTLEQQLRGWQGIAVKGGTPAPVVAALDKAVAAAVASPAFKTKISQLGLELVTTSSPETFQSFYLAELQRWGAFIQKNSIKAE